ncbi:putative membrane protein [Peribacillus deserti]|uniref:Membrane protein n=1 Tax=Peribacillus deserti TaxID=673318 RepID=A0ABS2QHS3_9BACI|nr:hypothetical protein [Peribacillus deserti]MBM7692720.1 putative membrane protein [Peribacillus deserti]
MIMNIMFYTSLTLALLLLSFLSILFSLYKRTKQRTIALGIIYLICSIPLLYAVIFTASEGSRISLTVGRVFAITWLLSVCCLFIAMMMTVTSIVNNWLKKQ